MLVNNAGVAPEVRADLLEADFRLAARDEIDQRFTQRGETTGERSFDLREGDARLVDGSSGDQIAHGLGPRGDPRVTSPP